MAGRHGIAQRMTTRLAAIDTARVSMTPYAEGDLDALHRIWTDAAVLGAAGIPSVLFGPGGAGLHSREEYVTTQDVVTCRDALSRLIEVWC